MLIVVVIIGILAAALIPRLQSVQARARDTKRKADLHQIGTALEIYREDNGDFTNIVNAAGWCDAQRLGKVAYTRYNPIGAWWGYWSERYVYQALLRYMTSVPEEQSPAEWTPNGSFSAMSWYVFIPLTLKWWQYKWYMVAAQTESAWGANRVANSVAATQWYPTWEWPNWNPSTDAAGNVWVGSLWGGCEKESIYQQYACTSIVPATTANPICWDPDNLWGGCITFNDGSGNCTLNQNASDWRYIYMN